MVDMIEQDKIDKFYHNYNDGVLVGAEGVSTNFQANFYHWQAITNSSFDILNLNENGEQVVNTEENNSLDVLPDVQVPFLALDFQTHYNNNNTIIDFEGTQKTSIALNVTDSLVTVSNGIEETTKQLAFIVTPETQVPYMAQDNVAHFNNNKPINGLSTLNAPVELTKIDTLITVSNEGNLAETSPFKVHSPEPISNHFVDYDKHFNNSSANSELNAPSTPIELTSIDPAITVSHGDALVGVEAPSLMISEPQTPFWVNADEQRHYNNNNTISDLQLAHNNVTPLTANDSLISNSHSDALSPNALTANLPVEVVLPVANNLPSSTLLFETNSVQPIQVVDTNLKNQFLNSLPEEHIVQQIATFKLNLEMYINDKERFDDLIETMAHSPFPVHFANPYTTLVDVTKQNIENLEKQLLEYKVPELIPEPVVMHHNPETMDTSVNAVILLEPSDETTGMPTPAYLDFTVPVNLIPTLRDDLYENLQLQPQTQEELILIAQEEYAKLVKEETLLTSSDQYIETNEFNIIDHAMTDVAVCDIRPVNWKEFEENMPTNTVNEETTVVNFAAPESTLFIDTGVLLCQFPENPLFTSLADFNMLPVLSDAA